MPRKYFAQLCSTFAQFLKKYNFAQICSIPRKSFAQLCSTFAQFLKKYNFAQILLKFAQYLVNLLLNFAQNLLKHTNLSKICSNLLSTSQKVCSTLLKFCSSSYYLSLERPWDSARWNPTTKPPEKNTLYLGLKLLTATPRKQAILRAIILLSEQSRAVKQSS